MDGEDFRLRHMDSDKQHLQRGQFPWSCWNSSTNIGRVRLRQAKWKRYPGFPDCMLWPMVYAPGIDKEQLIWKYIDTMLSKGSTFLAEKWCRFILKHSIFQNAPDAEAKYFRYAWITLALAWLIPKVENWPSAPWRSITLLQHGTYSTRYQKSAGVVHSPCIWCTGWPYSLGTHHYVRHISLLSIS